MLYGQIHSYQGRTVDPEHQNILGLDFVLRLRTKFKGCLTVCNEGTTFHSNNCFTIFDQPHKFSLKIEKKSQLTALIECEEIEFTEPEVLPYWLTALVISLAICFVWLLFLTKLRDLGYFETYFQSSDSTNSTKS